MTKGWSVPGGKVKCARGCELLTGWSLAARRWFIPVLADRSTMTEPAPSAGSSVVRLPRLARR